MLSNHSTRKTWGKKIYESTVERGQGDMALFLFMDMMNHSSPAEAKRYLGIRQEELNATYYMLNF